MKNNQSKISIPKQPLEDPFHPFLLCPKCKERKLRKIIIDIKQRKGSAKADRYTLKCDNCKHNFLK